MRGSMGTLVLLIVCPVSKALYCMYGNYILGVAGPSTNHQQCFDTQTAGP